MTPRILVVDDEPSIRHLLENVLADQDYDVVAASGALEALAQLEQERVPGNDYSALLMKAVKVLENGGSLQKAKAAVRQ